MVLAPTDFDMGSESNYTLAMKVTCKDDATRAMFIRATGHMLNYNHEQAIACFTACTELDPDCAMAWWGIAYCVSSNYNWAPGLGSGYDAIQQAVARKGHCTEMEQDLIDALATRHSEEARDGMDPSVLNMGNSPELNQAFADAMAPLHEKYAGDLDVTAIYVEALMNLNPWQLWDKDASTGEITPRDETTLRLVEIMEHAFETIEGATEHPALCHLYCHALELSPFLSEPYPRRTCFDADAGMRSSRPHALPHRCVGGAMEGSDRVQHHAYVEPWRRTTPTSSSPGTNPNSTSSTGCTTITSWSGVRCSTVSTRPPSPMHGRRWPPSLRVMITMACDSCSLASFRWVPSSSSPT